MKIKVLFFAQLRGMVSNDESEFEVPEGSSIDQILSGIPMANKLDWTAVRFAVNQEFEKGSKVLKDRDVLALLPPVSGG